MAKVAKMAESYPVHVKAEDSITTSLASSVFVVVARNALEYYSFDLRATPNYLGIASYSRYIVMVTMIVTNGNNISRIFYFTISQVVRD
jgi:hypothetical protein